MTSEEPLVSVITPFYNTADYLAEAIESVLAQKYSNFECLLVNNQSRDGSRDIALKYAAKDARIRVIDNPEFVSQVANYNGALEHIADASKYVKFAQADDVIFPDCISKMVELAEREPKVGIVSSYYLFGGYLDGAGIDFHVSTLPGREACCEMLRQRRSFLGSPTTVLYRADLVRARRPFYRDIPYMDDTEAAFEILLEHDLGFVHQILSFTRVDNESVMSVVRNFDPMKVFLYIAVEHFGRQVFSDQEFAKVHAEITDEYYRYLGKNWLRRPGERFWKFQSDALGPFNLDFEKPKAVAGAAQAVVKALTSRFRAS
ncbi:MAG TPA: glycosyltransferase family 2 protein [Polyangiaceae bacterium]|jgi:glycosyltransferase involved in cell wall biosynthesis|nr:glycosyltransferase family 2 protein [Polyangiaceae bacterium]